MEHVWLLAFFAGSCESCILNIHFVVRSWRSWIFKVCSALRSWISWILLILDARFSFHCGILEILDLYVLLLQLDPGDPGSLFFYCSGILLILDPFFVLPWDPGDLGSWVSDFVVRSCRSWILIFYFVVGSCWSWILILGCGTCLVACMEARGRLPGDKRRRACSEVRQNESGRCWGGKRPPRREIE